MSPAKSHPIIAFGVQIIPFEIKRLKLVGTASIPKCHKYFPVFKAGFMNIKTGRYNNWSIWKHGNRTNAMIPVQTLSDEEKKYSIKELIDVSTVIERLECYWRPEHECD